jgi:homoserine kinase
MRRVQLRLPATSANLGPGFDAMAIALGFFLEIDAEISTEFSIEASGHNADICARLTQNLLLETYERVLQAEGVPVQPLAMKMRNGIPIGKGCGSSAAVLLGGVALAATFGKLDWSRACILEKAAELEGHPDNVAACWHGGLSIAAQSNPLAVVSVPPPADWQALVIAPDTALSTAKARKALPSSYSREDVVHNLQAASLLTAAFALGRGDLMAIATRDRLHQPYRMELCPLLPALLPLAGQDGVLSVTLSGAGPSVLLLIQGPAGESLNNCIRKVSQAVCPVEIIPTTICAHGATVQIID